MMSLDYMVNRALLEGRSSKAFHYAAQQHANASVILFIITGIVWYFAGTPWWFIPLGFAIYTGGQSMRATQVATKLEELEKIHQ